MAESIEELYFRLGLDVADLKSGFINAEQTLSQNLRSLNNRENLIQLKTRVQLDGLDEAALGTEGLRLKQEELNQQLAIQEDRIHMTEAAYAAMVQSQGESSNAALNLSIMLEQERAAMARLERQTQNLAEQQRIALGVNWELVGAIEPTVKMIDIAAAGRTSFTWLGRTIPLPQVKLVTAALLGLSAVITGTMDATDELAENNSAQIFAENTQNAAIDYQNALTPMRAEVIHTADIIDKSFSNATASVNKNVQAQANSFVDWARDIFRVSFLLATEADNFSDAISKVNAQSQFMRTELGEYAVVSAGIYTSVNGLANSAISFVDKPIDDFKQLKLRANELNSSLSETQELLGLIDLAGAEYNDIRDFVRGVQDAVIKGDSEDPEVIALEKYGVVIQDANGKLLPFRETLKRLYEGFLKAKEAGEEEAYVIMTNGQAAQDVLPFFNELAKAKIKFNEISWSTSDFAALQQTSADLKLMEVQADELSNAIHSLGLPLADFAAQAKFNAYKQLTDSIEENRESILKWEFAFIGALEQVNDTASPILNEIKSVFKDFWQDIDDTTLDDDSEPAFFSIDNLFKNLKRKVLWNRDDIRLFYDYFPQLLPQGSTVNDIIENEYTRTISEVFRETLAEYIDCFDETYETILSTAEQDLEEYISENERARTETQKTADEINAGLSYSYNRIAKYKEELANIELDLKFDDDEYQKSLAKVDIWYEKAMRDAKYYAEEQKIINDLAQAKRAKIEQDNNKKIQEAEEESKRRTQRLLQEASNINFGLDKSPFEQQIRAIKQWEQEALASLDKYKDSIKDKNLLEQEAAAIVANALAKEREAFEREIDRIKGKTLDLHEKIFEQEHSQRDIDIMRVQKQVSEWRKDGTYNEDTIRHWEENEYANIAERSVGNADYIKTPRNRHRDAGGIPVIYADSTEGYGGNFNPSKNFYNEIQQQANADVANKFGVLTDSTQDLTNAQESLQKAIEIINGDELAQSYIQSLENVTSAQDNFAQTVAKEGDTLAQAIRDTAAKIGSVQLAGGYQQTEEDSIINRDNARVVFDAIQTGGEIAALVGASHANPALAVGGGIAAAAGGVGNMALDALDAWDSNTPSGSGGGGYTPQTNMPDINAAIKEIQNTLSKDIQSLADTTTSILQHVEKIAAREPVMNISPTINIDLGGAYVFDDAMKNQLTDDITENVTDAIKDAFNKEVRASSYSYGN